MTIEIPAGRRIADYGAAKDPKMIRAKGYLGVVRYVDGSLSQGRPSWKALTRTERNEISAAGLGLWLVFEQGVANWRGGFDQGVKDATLAARDADLLGYPDDMPILFAYDQDVTNDTKHIALEYWKGIVKGLGDRVGGVYGDAQVIEMVHPLKNCAIYWQPAAFAWSQRKIHPLAHVVQTVQGSEPGIDNNNVLKPISMWKPKLSPPKPEKPRSSHPILRLGARGAAVKECQTLLQKRGYYKRHAVDGAFGPATERAVKEFQANIQKYFKFSPISFPVDGTVGPKTWFWLTQ